MNKLIDKTKKFQATLDKKALCFFCNQIVEKGYWMSDSTSDIPQDVLICSACNKMREEK